MNLNARRILALALQLDANERRELAQALLDSLKEVPREWESWYGVLEGASPNGAQLAIRWILERRKNPTAGNLSEIDHMLGSIYPSRLSYEAMASVLTYTWACYAELPNRESLIAKCESQFSGEDWPIFIAKMRTSPPGGVIAK